VPTSTPPRILVAVEPRVLSDLVLGLLDELALTDVTDTHTGATSGEFAVALTSGALPAGIRAGAVIELPEDGLGAGVLRGAEHNVTGADDLLDLLRALFDEGASGT
jgi:hypothetical protein